MSTNFVDKIVIAPQLDETSHFDLYAVAIGSDDSFHAGNEVNLNPPGAVINMSGVMIWWTVHYARSRVFLKSQHFFDFSENCGVIDLGTPQAPRP